MERTLVLIKPDGVKRGLMGEIISRFEKCGLKVAAMKMVWVNEEFASKHYQTSRQDWVIDMGNKTLKTYGDYDKDPKEDLGTNDPFEIGKIVAKWNLEFLSSGPLLAILFEGPQAVAIARKIAGYTIPYSAESGTIRGDYSVDSPIQANFGKRAVHNLVHASGNLEEAQYEEKLWFKPEEIFNYKRADEEILYG